VNDEWYVGVYEPLTRKATRLTHKDRKPHGVDERETLMRDEPETMRKISALHLSEARRHAVSLMSSGDPKVKARGIALLVQVESRLARLFGLDVRVNSEVESTDLDDDHDRPIPILKYQRMMGGDYRGVSYYQALKFQRMMMGEDDSGVNYDEAESKKP
jgi:hypothetical protein